MAHCPISPSIDASTALPHRNLDVLRAIAVLCVFVLHASIAASSSLGDWLGATGVLLFFVHTSLVLMGSLERTQGEPSWIGRFYLRRAFRLYPVAILVVVGVVLSGIDAHIPVWHGPAIDADVPQPIAILANLALVQNVAGQAPLLTVLWTLPIEIQMYLVLPACFLVARRSQRWLGVALVVGVIVATAWGGVVEHVPGTWRLTTVPFVPCFLSGVLCYAILVKRPTARIASGWWLPIIGSVMVVSWALPANARWLVCLLLGLTIPFVRELPESILTRVGAIVARYSYAIYLLHVPALRGAIALAPNASAGQLLAITVILTAAGSWASYHLIEHPMILLGQRLATFRRPARRAIVAVDTVRVDGLA